MNTHDALAIVAGAVLGVGIFTAITLTRRHHRPCEAQWVVTFEGDVLRVCRQCGIDLSEFEEYHAERAATA